MDSMEKPAAQSGDPGAQETKDASPVSLSKAVHSVFTAWDETLQSYRAEPVFQEVGRVLSVGQGIARVRGLQEVRSEEVVYFENGVEGLVFNLDIDEVGVVLLGESQGLSAGSQVYRTGRVLDIPTGDALLGRVIDSTGRPLDQYGKLPELRRMPVERPAPAIIQRAPVNRPLQTGIKVIDALIPVGRGQRELILGDRQTGKTAIALDTMINQKGRNVICIYCAIGQGAASVARLIADLDRYDALPYSIVVVANGEDPPGLQYIAPYAATSIAEHFMKQGSDALVVYDDLTQHARAYRQLSLLLRRPPGREAFPGDIFYIHSRLLERATQLNASEGGGSLTALPIIETFSQNISAYIPTNLISITDGQIYLSPNLFQKGIFPAVDVGRSVSRVGGKAQLPAYQAVSGDLRLSYSQYEELEVFARFGTRLEERTQRQLERGRRVRESLKQYQYQPIPAGEQVSVLLAVTEGLYDNISIDLVSAAEREIRRAVREKHSDLLERIQSREKLTENDQQILLETMRKAVIGLMEGV